MKKRRKFAKLILLCSLIFTAASSLTTAYWIGGDELPEDQTKTLQGNTGNWIWYGVYEYDPNASYSPGDIVIYNGQAYWVRRNIEPGNPAHNPENPNEHIMLPMLYENDTEEYRPYHHYNLNDLVIYNNRVYRWANRFFGHNPNTVSGVPPESGGLWGIWGNWVLVSDTPDYDFWYPYKIYYEGNVVKFWQSSGNYRWYRSVTQPNQHNTPDSSSAWVEI